MFSLTYIYVTIKVNYKKKFCNNTNSYKGYEDYIYVMINEKDKTYK